MRTTKKGHHCKPRSRKPSETRKNWKKGKRIYVGASALTPGRKVLK